METEQCLYDQWMDNEACNLNNFTLALFRAFQYADGTNKAKIANAWPDYFKDSQYY